MGEMNEGDLDVKLGKRKHVAGKTQNSRSHKKDKA
jgi:hypothetical protein